MLTGLLRRPDAAGTPAPEQVHLQFGADASRQVAVSWAVATTVARPRLRWGPAQGGHGSQVDAEERSYTDALTGQIVWTYHARMSSLQPDTAYSYEVLHDGAAPVTGTFRTAPDGRSGPFRFTSFGDHAIPAPAGDGSGPHSPNAGYVVAA